MDIEYIMSRSDWESQVVSLLPDACTQYESKEDIAFSLALEFGILGGLVPSGWYPDEAVCHYIDREFEKGNISDSDVDEYNFKEKEYHQKMKNLQNTQ